jgi:uncharacterized protein with PQ loop repeat
MKPDWIGWVATAAFTSSYFVRNPARIRVIQALAACLWLGYGIVIASLPVIVANLLVVSAALFTLWRDRGASA